MTSESNEQHTVSSDSSNSTSSTIASCSSALSSEALGDSAREVMKHSSLKAHTLQESLDMGDLKRTDSPKHVSFDSVHVHEHAVILGCNPGIRALSNGPGPALTLSWDSLRSSNYNMEDFEAERELTRRPKASLRTTKTERVKYLKEEGFGSEELKLAEEAIRQVHRSREESAQEKSDLHSMLRDSKKRQLEKRRKKQGNFVNRLFRVFSAKT